MDKVFVYYVVILIRLKPSWTAYTGLCLWLYLINDIIPLQKPITIKVIETIIPRGRNINFDNFIVFSIQIFFLQNEALGLSLI